MERRTLYMIIGGVLAIILIVVFIVLGRKDSSRSRQDITLQWWRTNFETSDTFDDIVKAYQEKYPNVKIEITTFPYAEYETRLVQALAEGKGPDIASIHNDWLPKHKEKLQPLPLAGSKDSGFTFMNIQEYNRTFPDVAVNDLTDSTGIYGMPFGVDTLALFYNKDLLNEAGVPNPPANWTEFVDVVKRITKKNEQGRITLPAATIGTSTNVSRATDLLELLMLQNGSPIIDRTNVASALTDTLVVNNQRFQPVANALQFYTDFANPQKSTYTWDLSFDNSLDVFARGEVAMMFQYSYQIAALQRKAPNLNFAVAPMPQIEGNERTINYANYWAESVTKQSTHPKEAWDFIQFATNKDNDTLYIQASGEPTARRDLIASQSADPFIGVFANQVLTAKSWLKPNNLKTESIFAAMIDSVALGDATITEAINTANTLLERELDLIRGD